MLQQSTKKKLNETNKRTHSPLYHLHLDSNKMNNVGKDMLNRNMDYRDIEKLQIIVNNNLLLTFQYVIFNIRTIHKLSKISANKLTPCPSCIHVLLVWNHIIILLLIHFPLDTFSIDVKEKSMVIDSPNGIIWTSVSNPMCFPYLLKLKKFSLLV